MSQRSAIKAICCIGSEDLCGGLKDFLFSLFTTWGRLPFCLIYCSNWWKPPNRNFRFLCSDHGCFGPEGKAFLHCDDGQLPPPRLAEGWEAVKITPLHCLPVLYVVLTAVFHIYEYLRKDRYNSWVQILVTSLIVCFSSGW